MVTMKVYFRTFHISIDGNSGTAFAIDVDSRQYIVTARHLVEGIPDASPIAIMHDGAWKRTAVNLVGLGQDDIDVAVMAPQIQLVPPGFPVNATCRGLAIGQDAYILGFPFGLSVKMGELNRKFPLPFVKNCVIAACDFETDGKHIMFLDGHANPGFSGGPVVFAETARPDDTMICGVVSSYHCEEISVYNGAVKTSQTVGENTGIALAYGIKHALDLIRENPIGFPLTESHVNRPGEDTA